MTTAIFKPAADGFSLPAAQIVNRHLGNSCLYTKWVDASPARNSLAPVDLLDTHSCPRIWLKPETFAQGIATLFDPQFNFAAAKNVPLESKPATAYLLTLQQQYFSTLTILLENTPGGKCVLYYRSETILAIQEVSFRIFQRDLKEIAQPGHLSIGRKLGCEKYFGSISQCGPFSITCVAVPYPKPIALPFNQPFGIRRDLEFSVKSVCFSLTVLSFLYKSFDILYGLYGHKLDKKEYLTTVIPFLCVCLIARIIYNNISHNQKSPYGPFLINKNPN